MKKCIIRRQNGINRNEAIKLYFYYYKKDGITTKLVKNSYD